MVIGSYSIGVLRKESTYQYLQLFAVLLIPWGLFFSEAVASIAVILFAIPLILYPQKSLQNPQLRACWPFGLIYGIILISGFWSSDTSRWVDMLRVNLPYLILPLAFCIWPDFLLKRRKIWITNFIMASVLLAFYIILYFLNNSAEVLAGIRGGGSFEMPVHHVRTSLFLAIGGILVWHELIRHRWLSLQCGLWILALIIITTGIGLTAVRTGLIVFGLGTLMTFIFNKGYHTRKGIGWMSLTIVLALIGIVLIPTLREKWLYFIEDMRNYDSHSWWFYSDAVRWRSMQVGWEVFRDAPWWGVGLGDLLNEMHIRFYEMENIRLLEYPHNLWITFLAGTGLMGFMMLNISWLGIFGSLKNGPGVFRIIFFIFLVSCLVENTLLTSLGSISFVLFMLLGSGKWSVEVSPTHRP